MTMARVIVRLWHPDCCPALSAILGSQEMSGRCHLARLIDLYERDQVFRRVAMRDRLVAQLYG